MKTVYPAGLSDKTKKWYQTMLQYYGFDPSEVELLNQAAQCLDRIDEARAEIQKSGAYAADRYGNPRRHPALQTENDSKILFIRLLKALNIEQEGQRGPGRPTSF
jgi:hypothetical protein